jgi:hypothetical protein
MPLPCRITYACHRFDMVKPLGSDSLRHTLGPLVPASLGQVEVLDESPCDGYVRRHVAYDVPSGRASVFIGHSYGGRMAMWAPAWDQRIRASVSNCGCIPYRNAFARDAGFQADFVVPGFAAEHDVEDVLAAAGQCRYLLLAGADDVWSRGASEIAEELTRRAQGTSWSASGPVTTRSPPQTANSPTTSPQALA